MQNNKNYNSYYEKIGNEYNNIRLDEKNDRENVINLIKHYVNKKNAKILDIGCGTGKYGEMLKECGYQVIGIDKSITQVEQAKKIIEASVGDATNLSFPNNSFDACSMIIMIQQLAKKERIKAFKEAYRVLKENGSLIIKTCSHEDLTYRYTAKFFPKTLDIDKSRYPDIKDLKEELAIFPKIEIVPSTIIVEKSKEKFLEQYRKRGTSNFSFLTEEEIEEGISLFEETYKDQEKIKKITKHTFVIARKDK